MSVNNFIDTIKATVIKTKSSLCVGLDPEFEKIPDICKKSTEPYFEFNKKIIDATNKYVSFYKPQFAHYAAFGKELELEKTIKYIKSKYPEILVILDTKRGDIGNTAKYYALEAFNRYEADAVTVNPYMGLDSIKPFTEFKNKGVFVLCKTSNASSIDFQNLDVSIPNTSNAKKLYLLLANKAKEEWNQNQNIGLVVGATFTEDMAKIREISGASIPFLIPGIGAQGGDLESTLSASYSGPGSVIISSSRGIIHSDTGDNFDAAAKEEAKKLCENINKICSAGYNSKS